jgi:hypothetical protein
MFQLGEYLAAWRKVLYFENRMEKSLVAWKSAWKNFLPGKMFQSEENSSSLEKICLAGR